MERKTFGSLLTALRKANGMTQKDLAERLNVSDKAISRWERDENYPDLPLLPVIADIFGVTTDELLRGQRNSPDEDNRPAVSDRSSKQVKHLVDSVNTRFLIGCIITVGAFLAAILLRACSHFAYTPPESYKTSNYNQAAYVLYAIVQGLAWTVWLAGIVHVLLSYFSAKAKLTDEEWAGHEEALAEGRSRLKRCFIWTFSLLAAGIGLLLMDVEMNNASEQEIFGLILFLVLFAIFRIAWSVIPSLQKRTGPYLRELTEPLRQASFFKEWRRKMIIRIVILTLLWLAVFFAGLRTNGLAFAPGRIFFRQQTFRKYLEENSSKQDSSDRNTDHTIKLARTLRNFTYISFAGYGNNEVAHSCSTKYITSDSFGLDQHAVVWPDFYQEFPDSVQLGYYIGTGNSLSFRIENNRVGGILLGPTNEFLPIRVCTSRGADIGFAIWIILCILIPLSIQPLGWLLYRKMSRKYNVVQDAGDSAAEPEAEPSASEDN